MTKIYSGGLSETSLLKAREWIVENKEDGCICPACSQHVKLYRRKLHSAMALGLIKLYQHEKNDWVKVEDYFKSIPGLPATVRGDFAKLRHWGLIESFEGKREDGSSRNGFYRMTDFGIDFVQRKVMVHSHLYQFVGKSWLDGKPIDIVGALGKKFNYSELMAT